MRVFYLARALEWFRWYVGPQEIAYRLKRIALVFQHGNNPPNGCERLRYIRIWPSLPAIVQAYDTAWSHTMQHPICDLRPGQDPIAANDSPHNPTKLESALHSSHTKPAETIRRAQ